jgi:hypothetical protein
VSVIVDKIVAELIKRDKRREVERYVEALAVPLDAERVRREFAARHARLDVNPYMAITDDVGDIVAVVKVPT